MEKFYIVVKGKKVSELYGENEDNIYEDDIQILNEEEYKEFLED
jgi:hypothetical protein